MTCLAPCLASLGRWDMLHLPHVLPWVPLKLPLWLLPLPFLYLNELILSMTVAVAIPPFDLCWLKSLTVISCSFAMLEEGCICKILSPLFLSDPLLNFKMFCCMKQQFCPMYHFLCFGLVLTSLNYVLDTLIKLVSWLMFSLSDVAVHLVCQQLPWRLQGSFYFLPA